jgi:hypothetical protein
MGWHGTMVSNRLSFIVVGTGKRAIPNYRGAEIVKPVVNLMEDVWMLNIKLINLFLVAVSKRCCIVKCHALILAGVQTVFCGVRSNRLALAAITTRTHHQTMGNKIVTFTEQQLEDYQVHNKSLIYYNNEGNSK